MPEQLAIIFAQDFTHSVVIISSLARLISLIGPGYSAICSATFKLKLSLTASFTVDSKKAGIRSMAKGVM